MGDFALGASSKYQDIISSIKSLFKGSENDFVFLQVLTLRSLLISPVSIL